MRKNKEQKKGQETTIGKIIYGFLLFMPLVAIGSTLLISTFNMSAKQEPEITYKYETNEVNSINDLVVGNIYNFNFNSLESGNIATSNNSTLLFKPLTDIKLSYPFGDQMNLSQTITLPFVKMKLTQWNLYIYYDNSEQYYTKLDDIIFSNNFVAIYLGNQNTIDYTKFELTDYNEIESVDTHSIDTQEVFYNAIDKVTESPLFNWAQNSVIYTTTNATCNALSITAPFIPLLMSYWLIISVIYFLYDIALMLVWLIHKKIHELQETF